MRPSLRSWRINRIQSSALRGVAVFTLAAFAVSIAWLRGRGSSGFVEADSSRGRGATLERGAADSLTGDASLTLPGTLAASPRAAADCAADCGAAGKGSLWRIGAAGGDA